MSLPSPFRVEGVPAGRVSWSLVTDCSSATSMHRGPPSVEAPSSTGCAFLCHRVRGGPSSTGCAILRHRVRGGSSSTGCAFLRHRVQGLFVGCLTSQQQASVSQGRICSDNFTCCHTEIEVADQTFYLTQSQYTDTGPTSPSADPITPGAWQGSHWSVNF